MAQLLAASSINFTAANWLVVNATSLVDSEAASTALTTAYQNSTATTPGAIVVDGIAIKIASRAAGSPSNTITVRIGQAGADVAGTPTTMNVSDIDVCTSTNPSGDEGGWYYFRFNVGNVPTPVTLSAATAYTVGIKLSATTTAVSVFSTAGTNWSSMMATTTTAAPASGDRLCIVGDNLSPGVGSSYVVTMNNTATTSFGSTVTQALTINKHATLQWGITASTAYYLKIKGITRVFSGGTYRRGTLLNPMDATSTAIHEFDCTAAVDSGIEFANGSLRDDYGATTTTFTPLTIDKSAGNTVITGITSTAGWRVGDTLLFESSTITASQTEVKNILTVDSSTQVTLTAGLTNAHSGTSPTQIQVGNLTRTNKFRGVSSTLVGYVYIAAGAVINSKYVEYTALGNTTANRRGIDIQTISGAVLMDSFSIHDFTVFTAIGINITGVNTNNYTIQNGVMYNVNTTGVLNSSTTGSNYIINNNLLTFTGTGGGSSNLVLADLGGVITNNISSGAQATANVQITASDVPGTFSGNVVHSGANGGITITGAIPNGLLSTITAWRNTGTGITVQAATEVQIDGAIAFGNSSAGMSIASGSGNFELSNSTFNAGVTLLQPIGMSIASTADFRVNSCTFGATQTHATADITAGAGTVYAAFNNCIFASATEVSGQASMSPSAYIGSEKHDQTSGNNRTYRRYGNINIDTTIFVVSPSMRLTPNNAANKLQSLAFYSACVSGSPVTVSIRLRESVVGDGTAYNGSFPRLMVKKNVSIGITADTVIATATVASTGAFELVSGTTISPTENGTMQFYVDCDGTTGWINADSMTFSPVADTGSFTYWGDGYPSVYGNNSTGGGQNSATFY